MCGINGFTGSNKELISKMNDAIKYRGPDDAGTYVDRSVSLGARRLAIIDLSKAGHQPMANEDHTIWIVYNGEIYNFQTIKKDLLKKGHVFKSKTDTEVIIHAYEEWGINCVKKFNGMWSFCIYDINKNLLILSRDQFAIKPLYYYLDKEQLIFSSMISSILHHGILTAPNERIIMEYLAYNLQDHTSQTFFKNIYTLDPDKILIYNLKTKKSRFVKWFNQKKKRNDLSPVDVKKLFEDSIRLRTIADVPIGSCLSGGIDSTSIVCYLNELSTNKLNTFSYIAKNDIKDESRYINEVAKHTRINKYATSFDQDTFLDEVNDFVRSMEEPTSSLSPYAQYRVMKLAHTHKMKVLLDGQGGDEVFAGYDYYFAYYFYDLFANKKFLSLIKEMVMYKKNLNSNFSFLIFIFILFPNKLKRLVWGKFINNWINVAYFYRFSNLKTDPRWNKSSLQQILDYSFYTSAIPHLLKWEDKTSMRWSIESRVPFLDQNLVNKCLYLDPKVKLFNGKTKIIFRDAVRSSLPKKIINRTDKIGFETTVDQLFRQPKTVNFLKNIIYSDSFRGRPFWRWEQIEKKFNNHINNKINIGNEIWKWVSLEIWLQNHFPKYPR